MKNDLKLGDDLLAVIRELVQLAMLTGTNLVDHFRQIRVEVDKETNKLIPTEEYLEEYSRLVLELVARAKAQDESLGVETEPVEDKDIN
jgi:hypothetical protein